MQITTSRKPPNFGAVVGAPKHEKSPRAKIHPRALQSRVAAGGPTTRKQRRASPLAGRHRLVAAGGPATNVTGGLATKKQAFKTSWKAKKEKPFGTLAETANCYDSRGDRI
jgi:hypothetical protein